jgi:hypothetical protein
MAKNEICPEGTMEIPNNISTVLSGRMIFADDFQTLRVWLLSYCAFGAKEPVNPSNLPSAGK